MAWAAIYICTAKHRTQSSDVKRLSATTKSVRPRVIIIGGGFGGINAAKGLKNAPVDVILVDKHNYHLFQPLLYQVANAELEPAAIAFPIRSILHKQDNVTVALAEVFGVDFVNNCLRLSRGEIHYDYLIIASGVRQSYFGNDNYRPFAPGLKSLDDAGEIRRCILLAFEDAEFEADETTRRAKLTFVVVGGGPTGVELTGAIRDVASRTLPEDFRYIDSSTARVLLIHGGDRLLPMMPEDLSRKVQRSLEEMGAEIRLNSRVTDVTVEGVRIGDEFVAAKNVFWAAFDKGSMAAVGRGNAVAAVGKIHVSGFLGFLAWSILHLLFLVGFGRKVIVAFGWMINYFTQERQARLIIGDSMLDLKQPQLGSPIDKWTPQHDEHDGNE